MQDINEIMQKIKKEMTIIPENELLTLDFCRSEK